MAKFELAKSFIPKNNGDIFFSELQKRRNFFFDQLMDYSHEKMMAQNYDLLLSAYY
jgi:hypothetical protein